MNFLGLTIEDLNKAKIHYRIVKIDNNPLVVTRDYIITRLNVEIENGKVVSYHFG